MRSDDKSNINAEYPKLTELLKKIYEEKGVDLTQYRQGTLFRRIHSRMARCNVDSYTDYIHFLDRNKNEFNQLLNAITINVTDFFRNPECFIEIEKKVIPSILLSKISNRQRIIRAWSCGCSTGDEVYSLAMLFLENIGELKDEFILSIIGSDIDKNTLIQAQNLTYNRKRLNGVREIFIAKYFDKIDNDKYRIKDSVKKTVKFREYDIILDPSYKHCDIILCRNLLIYFNRSLQESILIKFYDSLNPGGYLILGMTENLVGNTINIFEHIENRLRIYRKPENIYPTYNKESILSQKKIDRIVKKIT